MNWLQWLLLTGLIGWFIHPFITLVCVIIIVFRLAARV